MDFAKFFTGLKVATSVVENEGKLDQNVIMSAFFDRRMSTDKSFFDSINSLVMNSSLDYPDLKDYRVHEFTSGKNTLKGYLFHPEGISKGLILFVHGLGGSAFDWYAIPLQELLRRGFSIFAIELTASGSSGGFGIDGLHQSALDVSNAVNYIKSNSLLKDMPLFLFGHSWGGYGVSACLNFQHDIRAVVEISGFASPIDEMASLPEAKMGGANLVDRSMLLEALSKRAGEYADLSAVEAISSSDTPVFAIHGSQDQTVPYESASILYKAKSFSNVTPLLIAGKDHVSIFLSSKAIIERKRAYDYLSPYQKEFGKNLSKWPKETVEACRSAIHRNSCSELDATLFDKIEDFYLSHL